MAQRTIVTKTDDLAAKQGNDNVTADETFQFSFKDSGPLEIDLSEVNGSQFTQAIMPFVNAARPVEVKRSRSGGGKKAPAAGGAKAPAASASDREENEKRREFWRELVGTKDDDGNVTQAGLNADAAPAYSTRGRIPNTVQELYTQFEGNAQAAADAARASETPSSAGDTTAAPSADDSTPAPTDEVTPSQEESPAAEQVPQADVTLPEGYRRDTDGTILDDEGYPVSDTEQERLAAV